MLYIGIDPGVNTGLAVWDSSEKDLIELSTVSFWDCVKKMEFYSNGVNKIKFYIENPNLNKPIFARNANDKAMRKIAQNVGSNKRDAKLLIEWCENNGVDCIGIKPTSKKWDASYFKYITGINQRCSQHARDAAKLVFGL